MDPQLPRLSVSNKMSDEWLDEMDVDGESFVGGGKRSFNWHFATSGLKTEQACHSNWEMTT